jgi:hypothetical protein
MTEKRSVPLLLTAVSVVCTALSLFFLLLWVVNLEAAIQLFFADTRFLSRILPAAALRIGEACAADLSSVSTLVPLLMFAFPAFQGFRALVRLRAEEDDGLLWRPYPPHFAFFLIMLGLTGTLYGLLIGLQSSGVEALAASGLSGKAVQDSVQRLLSGTATAVLSSLVGLVGAFIAARPLSWVFCQSLPLDIAEELPEDLEATVDRLCEGLGRMDRTVREVTRSLEPLPLDQLAQQLGRLESQNNDLVDGINKMCSVLERCAEGLSVAEGVEQRMAQVVTELSGVRRDQASNTASLNASIVGAGNRIQASVNEQVVAQAVVIETLREIGDATRAGTQLRKQERSRLRRALAMFSEEQSDNA